MDGLFSVPVSTRPLQQTGAVLIFVFSMAMWTIPLEHLACVEDEASGSLILRREPSMICDLQPVAVAAAVLYGSMGFLGSVYVMKHNYGQDNAKRWWLPSMIIVKLVIVLVTLWAIERPLMQTIVIAVVLAASACAEVRPCASAFTHAPLMRPVFNMFRVVQCTL